MQVGGCGMWIYYDTTHYFYELFPFVIKILNKTYEQNDPEDLCMFRNSIDNTELFISMHIVKVLHYIFHYIRLIRHVHRIIF